MNMYENPEPRCRGCDRKVRLRDDGTVGPHKSGRAHQCPRAGTRPAGEPPCFGSECVGGLAGVVTSGEFVPDDPHAVPVCHDPAHHADASEWIEEKTGKVGRFEPVTVSLDVTVTITERKVS